MFGYAPPAPEVPGWFRGPKGKRYSNVKAGLHPFGGALGPEGKTCGSCSWIKKGRKVYNCSLLDRGRGVGKGARLRWRACERWAGDYYDR